MEFKPLSMERTPTFYNPKNPSKLHLSSWKNQTATTQIIPGEWQSNATISQITIRETRINALTGVVRKCQIPLLRELKTSTLMTERRGKRNWAWLLTLRLKIKTPMPNLKGSFNFLVGSWSTLRVTQNTMRSIMLKVEHKMSTKLEWPL